MSGEQNGTQYEIWISRPEGTKIAVITQAASFDYLKVLSEQGRFNLTVPLSASIGSLLKKDFLISFWRQPVDGSSSLDFRGLLSHWEYYDNANGDTLLKASGFGLNSLLNRRIVYAKPGTAQAAKTAAADNMMKAYVTDQLSSAAAAPQVAGIPAAYFTVAANVTLGPSISQDQSNNNLLSALKAISDAARQAGTEVYFDMVPTGGSTFEFRTYVGQPGADHTTAANKVLIAKERGNLANPRLTIDYDSEANTIISWGGGHNYKVSQDTARSGLSIFALNEFFLNQSNLVVGTQVQAGANAELTKHRPSVKFTGDIVDVPGTRYGVNWNWGDKLSASYAGYQFPCLVRSVSVAMDENKRETIKSALEGTISL